MTTAKPPFDEVTIKYDAANSFNAMLRDERSCFFKPGQLQQIPDPYQVSDMNVTDMSTTDMNATVDATDNAEAEAPRPKVPPAADEPLDNDYEPDGIEENNITDY